MGTFTFVTPPEVIEEEQVPPEEKGACFKVTVNDEPCFSVSPFQKECFFINVEEDEDKPFKTEIDLSPFGFINIKAITSHGNDSLVIIAQYSENEGDDPIGVMANILYDSSISGGIGDIKGVMYLTPLADISLFLDVEDKILYDDVLRLECYDITTGLSKLAIVTTKHVYWVDALLFTLNDTSIGHVNEADAIADPFFFEDTYSKTEINESEQNTLCSVPPFSTDSDCGSGQPSSGWTWVVCDSGCSHVISTTSPHILTYGNKGVYTSIKQGDEEIVNTGIAGNLVDWVYDDFHGGSFIERYAGTDFGSLRGNVAICGSKLIGGIDWENTFNMVLGCTGITRPYANIDYCEADDDKYHQIYRKTFAGAMLPINIYNTLPDCSFTQSSIINLCGDGIYIAVGSGANVEYSKINGSGFGSKPVDGDFTLSGGVLLSVDGTDTIKQVVLANE